MINAQAFVHYKTGIKHLDEQHWELFLNLDALAACDNKDAAIAVIDNVIHQWALHSQAEEEYMAKIHYPFLAPHAEHHILFLEKFYNLKKQIKTTNFQYGIKFHVAQLEEILRHHIEFDDLQYADFEKKK